MFVVACGVVACGAATTDGAAPSSPSAVGEPTTPCPELGDDRSDRPALVSADTELACERAHGGGAAALSRVSFVTRTWTSLSLDLDRPEAARCARAEIERRMKKR